GPAYISRIEAGLRVPSLQVIHEFARRLGVAPEYISHGQTPDDDPEAPLLQAEVALRLGAADEASSVFETLADKPGPYQVRALADLNQFDRAQPLLVEAIRLADESRDPLTHARIYWAQSRFHILSGEPDLAARYARRALAIFERTENDSFSAMVYHLLAYAEVEAGEAAAALEHLERGRELFAATMTPIDDAKFAIEEARALLALRRLKSAARAASRALALMEALDPGDRGRSY